MQAVEEMEEITNVLIELLNKTSDLQVAKMRDVKMCVECFKDIRHEAIEDLDTWRSALFDICTIDDPITKANAYLYQRLYDFLKTSETQTIGNETEDAEIYRTSIFFKITEKKNILCHKSPLF